MSNAVEEDQQNATQRRAMGEFVRGVSGLRNWLSVLPGDGDGSSTGTTTEERFRNATSPFQPEPGRYHLFVAYNCPWCHRCTLARSILGLDQSISMDVAFPNRTPEDDPIEAGRWEFNPGRLASLTGKPFPECTGETATGKGFRLAKQIYEAQGSSETSVPILYDKKLHVIVNNESADILRMLATHAVALGAKTPMESLSPGHPFAEATTTSDDSDSLETLNILIYNAINNGAYKAGFSSNQSAYKAAFTAYFEALDVLERRLSDGRSWLMGDEVSEADLRLFPTLYRHDPVYYVRMKLNGARMLDYPNLWRWICRFYSTLPGVQTTGSNLLHCRQGYFGRSWNNVVPLGPFKPMPYPEAYLHPELALRDH